MSSYDPIDEALNTTSAIEVSNITENDCGQIIKSVADTTDKLMELQKKIKDVDDQINKQPNNVTNNSLFVGSTSELSKLLKKGFLNNNTQTDNKKN